MSQVNFTTVAFQDQGFQHITDKNSWEIVKPTILKTTFSALFVKQTDFVKFKIKKYAKNNFKTTRTQLTYNQNHEFLILLVQKEHKMWLFWSQCSILKDQIHYKVS